jgi:hypothetical protein
VARPRLCRRPRRQGGARCRRPSHRLTVRAPTTTGG